MKKKFLSLILVLTASFSNAQVEYVDPTIGGVGVLEPTRPTVHLPNSMIRVYPIRNDQLDDQIKSFPLTMVTHRLGVFFGIMPGEDKPAAWDQEITTPYYYSTRFDDSLIQTEFSPAEQSGYYRFHFPKKNAEIHLKTVRNGELKQIDEKTVSGFEELKPTPSIEPMRAYFYGELSESFKGSVQENGGMKHLTLKSKGEVIGFRYGISYISIDQAKKNLHREIPEWNFELVKNNAKARWNKTLSQIEIKGGTESQKRVFYTALYRTYERMVNITEGGRYYSAYDRQVHEDSRPFYVDNWLWDSYHAQGPLNVLLNPEMTADQIQSYIRMYEQSGWVPSFALLWGDWPAMNGNHAAAWFSDAWFKGIRNFDMKKGLEGVRKNSLEATLLPWANGPKTALDEFYNQNGFFPGIREDEKETEPRVVPNEYRQSVSVTLANSYDDWCIAQISRSLGDRSGYDQFIPGRPWSGVREFAAAQPTRHAVRYRGGGPGVGHGCARKWRAWSAHTGWLVLVGGCADWNGMGTDGLAHRFAGAGVAVVAGAGLAIRSACAGAGLASADSRDAGVWAGGHWFSARIGRWWDATFGAGVGGQHNMR